MTPKAWLDSFAGSLSRGDVADAPGLFGPECYWRDLVAFTWDIETAEGRSAIKQRLDFCLLKIKPRQFAALSWWTADPSAETWFSFDTAAGRGVGHVRLREGRAWTLLTALRELKDFPERPGAREPDLGVTREPDVVIVGGGQGGIALGARLKRLGVPALILEANARAGDSWRKRYASLVLHDPVWYDHMPYKPFPKGWPVFSPKDALADWLEAYADEMQLDYWGGSPCLKASFEERNSRWSVDTLRDGKPVRLRPRHLVLATGMSGFPNWPPDKGAASQRRAGGSLLHSSGYKDGAPWRGKKCVVVGASTSAHDICADLHGHGADVTMVQRSPTIVATTAALLEHAWGRLYSEAALANGIGTELADLTLASVPFKVLPALQRPVYEVIEKRDKPFYDALARAGFLFDFGEDGSGLHTCYLRRGAGYYIETGASKMIIEGKIKLARGELARVSEHSVTLAQPPDRFLELPADLVVLATGYRSMSDWAAQLISPEVAERVGKCWGLGSDTRYDPGPWEGELRNMWKPTKQKGLWFHGGNLMQARHYSLYLALQLAKSGSGTDFQ